MDKDNKFKIGDLVKVVMSSPFGKCGRNYFHNGHMSKIMGVNYISYYLEGDAINIYHKDELELVSVFETIISRFNL